MPLMPKAAHKHWNDVRRGAKDSIPVIVGLVPLGLVLGAQASQKGMKTLEVTLMTALNYAGGSEFAVIELWSSPPNIILIVTMTFLINSRHLVMGATLAPLLKHIPRRRTLPALFFMCDESWAMSIADARRASRRSDQPSFSFHYYLGIGLLLWFNWVVFTSLGAWLGPALTDLHTWGFDMVFPAVFLVLVRGMWQGFVSALPWMISLMVAAVAWLWLPHGWHVVTGTLSGVLAAFFLTGHR